LILDSGSTQEVTRSRATGIYGETLAAQALLADGYRIVSVNFKVPVGRNSKGVAVTGEIDIIALDGETLCFIEVKTRRSEEFAAISAAVDLKKQRQITRTSKVYRRLFKIENIACRFDVVTVLLADRAEPVIEVLKDFWSESSFRKRSWNDNSWYDHY